VDLRGSQVIALKDFLDILWIYGDPGQILEKADPFIWTG